MDAHQKVLAGILAGLTIVIIIVAVMTTVNRIDEYDGRKAAYTRVNFENGNFSIWMTKAFLVNDPEKKLDTAGTIVQCKDFYKKLPENVIAVIDFEDVNCVEKISDLEQEEDEVNNYNAIIFLDNWDSRTSRSYPDMVGKAQESPTQTITNIKLQTKVPVLSIPKKDNEYFKTGLYLSKGYTMDITFKSLSSLLEDNGYTPSPLFEVSCTFDTGKGCLHFFSNPPKSGEYFLGCKGKPKKRVDMDIRCKSHKRDCPELQAWKKTLPRKEDHECAVKERSLDPNNVYPPLTCKQKSSKEWDYFDIRAASCPEEKIHGKPWFDSVELICSEDQNLQKNHPNCAKDVTCRKWGRWSAFSECTKQREYSKQRHRFCKDIRSKINSTDRCVIREAEEYYSRKKRDNCNEKYLCYM